MWDLDTGDDELDISESGTSHATCMDLVETDDAAMVAVAGVRGSVKIVVLNTGNIKVAGHANCFQLLRTLLFQSDFIISNLAKWVYNSQA